MTLLRRMRSGVSRSGGTPWPPVANHRARHRGNSECAARAQPAPPCSPDGNLFLTFAVLLLVPGIGGAWEEPAFEATQSEPAGQTVRWRPR
jgi:hypothetical protein